MSSNLSNVVLSLVAGARKDAVAVVAVNLRAVAHAYAMNGGAKNALTSARNGIREGRKGIAAGTLAALTLASLDAIESTGADAGARAVAGVTADDAARAARAVAADAFADGVAQAFRDAVQAASDARKAKAKAGKDAAADADAGAGAAGVDAAPAMGEDGNADGTNVPRAVDGTAIPLDAALSRVAGFAAESLADALADSPALARLREALACLDARAAVTAEIAELLKAQDEEKAAADAAGAVVGKAKGKRSRKVTSEALPA